MDTHFLQVDKKVKYLWPETIKLPHEVTEETVHDLALPPFWPLTSSLEDFQRSPYVLDEAGKRPAAVSYNTRVKTLDQNHQPHPAVSSLAIVVQMFTPGFKKHNPPWVPWLLQQAGVHAHCMPAILPARALPRVMGVNTHIIQKEQLARKDGRPARCSDQLLISLPLREPTPVVKVLTTGPLPLSGQGKQRTAQMWHSGFGKVLTVITGCYAWPRTRVKVRLQEKSLWVPTPCVVLQVTIKCVNTASE